MHTVLCSCLAWTLCLSACSSSDPDQIAAGGAAARAGASNMSGAPGAAGMGSPSGGASGSSPAGGSSVAGASGRPPAVGGGDNGDLFDPSNAVPFDPNAGGSGGTPGSGGTGGVNTNGVSATSHVNAIGSVDGTAVFTQHGVDVTVVVKLTKCPDGVLGLHINSGDSCDNADAEKLPWDGKRGNIGDTGTITCKNNSASLTYTRSGADPALNWTVGDHNYKTDVTNYVVIVSKNADGMSNFIGCGNFFGG